MSQQHQPAEVAVERVFVSPQADSALKLGRPLAPRCAAFPRACRCFEYCAPQPSSVAVLAPDSENFQ